MRFYLIRLPHATSAHGLVDRAVVAGRFVPFTCGWNRYLVLQRPSTYGIAAFMGHGSVKVHGEGGDWLAENGWRCVPKDAPDGHGLMSGDRPLRGCLGAERVSPPPCDPCRVFQPGLQP
jgi:hypothetical protein